MIISCDNDAIREIDDYIGDNYPKCLYLYLNIQQYGCRSENTHTWLQKDNGVTKAVMLSYHSALHVYAKEMDFDVIEMTEFIITKAPSIICASAELIRKIAPGLSDLGYISEFGHIGKFSKLGDVIPDDNIGRATNHDICEIAQLLYEDDDIGASYTMEDLVKQIEDRLKDGFVRSYVIKEDGHVVAHLGTGAETEKVCTVSYVITAPEYRGRGLSSRLFAYACNELVNEGKEIYSVYYPENSRRLHHKMGFEDCCEFGKLYKIIRD